jgi:hypothetical protein
MARDWFNKEPPDQGKVEDPFPTTPGGGFTCSRDGTITLEMKEFISEEIGMKLSS